MPMFLRTLLHRWKFALTNFLIRFMPGANYLSFVGPQSSHRLCDYLLQSGYRRVLVVTDGPLRELGVADRALAPLLAADVDVAWYDGVLPDPTYGQVAAGAAIKAEHRSDVVVAVGGGSSMDCAKLIAACMPGNDQPREWVGFGKIKHDITPVYAIPTTSGTGSEATMGAVVSDDDSHKKDVISGAPLLPAACALDPDLITGLPPHITAATGMDALTHGIEAYIGIWERGTRRQQGAAAVKQVFIYLERAVRDGEDKEARQAMSLAAYQAGIAINQVNVGNVHAIAHQLGAKYGIPHGLANALVLPRVLEFCREESATQLAELARLVGVGAEGASDLDQAAAFIEAVTRLRTAVGIADHSDKLREADFDDIATAAMEEGAEYPVPRLLDRESTLAILRGVRG